MSRGPRVALALGGTDAARSGIGVFTRAILPTLASRLAADGGELLVSGTPRDLAAYAVQLRGVRTLALPAWLDRAGPSAAWHYARFGSFARAHGAEVVLMPAANRRVTGPSSPLPAVAVVHDLAALDVRGKYDALRTSYVRVGVVRGIRAAQRVLAVSEATRAAVGRHTGMAIGAVRVVPNGCDVTRFVPLDHARAGKPYVLYVSRLEHPGKNHARLLRGFARSSLRSTHDLVFAGEDWGGRVHLETVASQLGLGRSLRFLGRVGDDALPALVANADACVMLGLHEGFGLPVLEAFASGRPVLVARAGALPEIAGPLAALCDPLDESSIAEGLARVASDAKLRARARAEGPAWARGFSWERTSDGLHRACCEVAA